MSINEKQALVLLDGNRDLLKELATIFSEDANVLVQDFEQAVETRETEKARLAIHSLKGITASFFAEAEIGLFASIESSACESNWSRLDEAKVEVKQAVASLISEMKARALVNAN